MPVHSGAITAPYLGTLPSLDGPLAFGGAGAVILGRARLGRDAWLDHCSVIRADGHDVDIGKDFHLGAHATVHIAHDVYPTRIGNRVTAGQGAVIHACTVGDGCVVDRGAIILDGSVIGAGAVISAGSVVFPRSELDGGWLYSGSPAKRVARVTPSELEAYHQNIRNTRNKGPKRSHGLSSSSLDCFVAPSAIVVGDVRVGEGVGIWYGCMLNAAGHSIHIGDGTNVQDNSSIICETGDVFIAADVTIGHNVSLVDCRVETGSLVGIGSVIAAGTVVESDVLVAAGAETEPGQRLTGGWVWAGRPARPIGRMDARKQAMLAGTLPTYRNYAAEFRRTPHTILNQNEEA